VVVNYQRRTDNLFCRACSLTSVSDAGHTDGACRSFRWSRFHLGPKSTGRRQSEGRLSLEFSAGGRVSAARQGGAVARRRRGRGRPQTGHCAATASEASWKSLGSFRRVTAAGCRRVPRVPPIHPSTSHTDTYTCTGVTEGWAERGSYPPATPGEGHKIASPTTTKVSLV